MEHLKQFAQRTLAEETKRVTGGAVEWQNLPEIRLEKVQSDEFTVIRRPHLLEQPAPPWPEELLWRFGKVDDPEIEARRQHILQVLLEQSPQTKQQLIDEGRAEGQQEGRLTEARAALRQVLGFRQLTPSRDDDARIDACTDLATLRRWLTQSITADTIADALA